MAEHPTYVCPVCAFDAMDDPPEDHAICACCGTHFGYQNVTRTPLQLRDDWLRRGGAWFDVQDPHFPGYGWNAWRQLEAAGLPYDVTPAGDLAARR